MELKKEAICLCDNWCKDGEPTPYPLGSRETPEKNEMGEYCMICGFMEWEDVDE